MGRRIIVFFLIFILIFTISPAWAFAQSSDYVVDGLERIPIPKTYVLKKIIYNPGSLGDIKGTFKSPEDLFINEQGYIFVADTGNNRIVKLSGEGEIVSAFYGPEEKPLLMPRGVYADKDGNMYIADTGNQRILHLSSTGEYVEEFGKPESELLGDVNIFDPSKVFVIHMWVIFPGPLMSASTLVSPFLIVQASWFLPVWSQLENLLVLALLTYITLSKKSFI
jgi:hypothetical protein